MVRRLGLPAVFAALLVCLASAAALDEPPPSKKAGQPPANRLARETSPYLRLHAHNPVDWYPWGPEALARAKKEDKLIFLSIGYSSCYWCHVMERQSFANEEIARIMNERFVCIKVDREERPDVDTIYMHALHVQGRRGGWPLSLFLTPDGKPVGGGTYYPPEDREIDGRKVYGFKSICLMVQEDWLKNRAVIVQHAEEIAEAVKRSLALSARGLAAAELNRDLVAAAVDAARDEYDPEYGGFGSSARKWAGPKFPQPATPELLLAEYRRTKDEALLRMLTHTFDRMYLGGIYDHLGGGFHRYTVDREWKIPHFEKMLYDNAQLVSLYARLHQLTGKPAYRRVVEETIGFVARELTSPDGGFYCALDAETDAEEGKFYVWTAAEIDAILGEHASLFKQVYGVAAGPNFEGKYSVLQWAKPPEAAAAERGMTEDQLLERLLPLRQRLLEARSKRTRPLLDTKVLTAWNGMMIAGLAEASRVFGNPDYAARAERAAQHVLNTLRKDGRLLRTASPGAANQPVINGYLEDYAFLIHGMLALEDATRSPRWLQESMSLADEMVARFYDRDAGAFFFTAHDHERLFARAKDQYDGALPSGNSMAVQVLVRLAGKPGGERFREPARKTLEAFSGGLKENPASLPAMAHGLGLWLDAQKPGNTLKEKPADGKESNPR